MVTVKSPLGRTTFSSFNPKLHLNYPYRYGKRLGAGSREILWDSDVWLVRIQIGTGPNVGETRSLNIPRDRGPSADVG
jgi:hypothetical protein